MITHFPSPHPDELIYSLFSRYYTSSGSLTYRCIAEDLFQNRFSKPDIEFVNVLTPEGYEVATHTMTWETLIMEHTMFKYYARFMPPPRMRKAYDALCTQAGGYRHLLCIPNSNQQRFLRFCPVCAETDRSQYGETYWHCQHQMIGIDLCPLHFCRLYSSSVPISGNGSPNLITAEEAVPTDAAIHLPENALERSLAAYIAAVSHASLNIQQEIPTCRFLHSRLENTKYVSRRGQQRNMELLFQDYSAFYQGYSGNTLTQQWQLQKVFSGQRMIPHEVCMVAYLLDITVNDLAEFKIPEQSQSTRFDSEVQKFRANGMNYVQIAKQMNASYDSIKLIGKGTYSTRRKKATQAKSRKTKKHDWKYTDATLLPPVQAVIQRLTAATDEKPIRITLGLIERMLMLPDKTLIRCPKCKAHIEQHVISQHMHWEKLIIWAIRRLLQDGKPIHPTNIMKLTNLRKKDLLTTLGLSDTASSSEIGGTLLKIIS